MFVRKNTGSFYIYTLGCKTNQSESDSIAGELLKRGLKPRSPGESPDIIIINTCTVTSAADRKARQAILLRLHQQWHKRFEVSILSANIAFAREQAGGQL